MYAILSFFGCNSCVPVEKRSPNALEYIINFFKSLCFSIEALPLTPNRVTHSSRTTPYPSSAIRSFYQGELRPEPLNKTIDEVLASDDDFLESCHCYIQWLFPLPSVTSHNRLVALLDGETIDMFREWTKFIAAFERMLRFYGLELVSSGGIIRANNFNERKANWMTPGNHNYLRITRIITSLSLMCANEFAKDFEAILQDIASNEGRGIIPKASTDRWREALTVQINDL